MLVLQKGLILPVPMYGGSYFFIQPSNFHPYVLILKADRTRTEKLMQIEHSAML